MEPSVNTSVTDILFCCINFTYVRLMIMILLLLQFYFFQVSILAPLK